MKEGLHPTYNQTPITCACGHVLDVRSTKKELKVDCCAKAGKPRKKNFIKILDLYKYDLSEVAIIGDQLVTDIYGGNKVGITTVLVNPMSNIDMPFTKIHRYIERKKINKMTKAGIFKVGEYYD